MERILGEFQEKYDVEVEIVNIRASKENRERGKEYGLKYTPYTIFFNEKGKKLWSEIGIVYEKDLYSIFKRYSVKIKERGASE